MLNIIKAIYKQQSTQHIILLSSLSSIFFAWRLIFIQHGWVNDDFVLYHESARLFSLGEFKQGFALFGWPLYSLLISGLHNLTGVDLTLSAQLITIGLFAITTYSFLNLIQLAGGDKLTIVCGTSLLFSSHYIAGDVLSMLLRDPGFWAFFLTSLVFFVRYYNTKAIKDALLWQCTMIIATLFRIEGVTFLALLPLYFLHVTSIPIKQRLLLTFKAHSINFFILAVLTISLIISPSLSINDLGRLQEIISLVDYRYQKIISTFLNRADLFATNVLMGHFDSYALIGLITAFISIVILKCIGTLGWLNSGLIIHSFWYKSTQLNPNVKKILLYTSALGLLNILFIILSVLLLSGRYIAPLALTLMVIVSFVLSQLIKDVRSENDRHHTAKTVLLILTITWISLSIVKNTLPKQQGYNFEQDAIAYIKQHNIPNNEIFFVTPRARYYAEAAYAGRHQDYWEYTQKAIQNGSIYKYKYLIIPLHIDQKYKEQEKYLIKSLTQYKITKEFYGYKKKKKVVLFTKKTDY